ncbi:carboxymuconolactone decarboxylase family protein, partial [Klebsiella variicola]|uniref:carboxymuconolactone decarboxylase family protein n=2 Tax=Klebsiella/Raoultella group TaxID=2890311 RepID=UPI001F27F835
MKAFIAVAAMSLMLGAPALAEEKRGEKMAPRSPSVLSAEDIQSVAPALARFCSEVLIGDLWQRTELSRRDRSIVTVAILIARNQPAELKHNVEVALDNDVTAAEISEIVTHLAF